jgi:hypothetical protein
MPQETLKEKLEAIKALVDECLAELGAPIRKPTRLNSGHSPQAAVKDLPLQIANKIGDCDESNAIQLRVLDRRSMDGKILLCFYVSSKYFGNAWLTSGDIEKITSQLGVKIDKRNASNSLAKLRQYLESGAVRKGGQPTPYRMNRKGVQRLE